MRVSCLTLAYPFAKCIVVHVKLTHSMLIALRSTEVPHLARFKGRPGELSPKARLYLLAGWLLPSRFKYVLYFQSFPHKPN